MNVIVAGAGEVGFHIAERLSKEGHSVTVIEKNPAKETLLKSRLNALVVRGSGASTDVLDQAGIEKADLFIAVTDQDEVNLVSCLLAHQSGCRRIVGRIRSLEYTTSEWTANAAKLGIDLLVNPQTVVADDVYRIVSYPAASEAAEFAGGRVVFLGYQIAKDSPVAGVPLKVLAGIRGIYRMVLTAIARKNETLIPRGDDVIQEGDVVYFVCKKQDVPSINYLFGLEKEPSRRIFVLGGGRIGEALARKLAAFKLAIKLVEPDPAVCQRLAEELEGVTVVNAEGTDVQTLKHEGIADCDVFVAATADEQANILCALLAKSYGAKRAIATVDRHEFVALAPSLGMDACVSPRLSTASAILRHVRPTGIASLATIEQTNADVLELVLSAENRILGKPLKELDVPAGSIVGIIVRGESVIIPDGEDHFEANDHVVVFALPHAVARVEEFFA